MQFTIITFYDAVFQHVKSVYTLQRMSLIHYFFQHGFSIIFYPSQKQSFILFSGLSFLISKSLKFNFQNYLKLFIRKIIFSYFKGLVQRLERLVFPYHPLSQSSSKVNRRLAERMFQIQAVPQQQVENKSYLFMHKLIQILILF